MILPGFLALALAAQAHACRFRPDPRPLETRAAASPLAFVGTVETTAYRGTKDVAVLRVELPLKGLAPGAKTFKVTLTGSSCDLSFEKGQRWLFAGAGIPSPSSLLGEPNGPELKTQRPADLDLPAAWFACASYADCGVIRFGCERAAAVGLKHLEPARRAAQDKFGDPRTLNCKAAPGKKNGPRAFEPAPYCLNGSCVMAEVVFPAAD